MSSYYNMNRNAVLDEVKSRKEGLTSSEALKHQTKFGLNKMPEGKKRRPIVRFLAQFTEIMIVILLIASGISIAMAFIKQEYGELVDGGLILLIVFANAIIGFVQEQKAEKEMQSLMQVSEPESKVLRDGEYLKIKGSQVTVGDIIILEAGDIVSADVRLIETASLKVDESALTGESVAVEKDASANLSETTSLGDRKNMAYKGSVITFGRGTGVVVAVGALTEMGKIARMLHSTKKDDTPLQRSIKLVGKVITLIVCLVAAATFVLEVIERPGDMLNAFLTAVAVAVAAIPEGLTAVITVIMSMGVARLAKQKAIIKRLHAVETLGSCDIICSDKTGTLTTNVMTVKQLYYSGALVNTKKKMANEDYLALTRFMALCNDAVKAKAGYKGDPTETALTDYAHKNGLIKSELETLYPRIAEQPFDSVRKLMTTAHSFGGRTYCITKGAPDVVLSRCTQIQLNGEVVKLTKSLKEDIVKAISKMGRKALRVLGFAYNILEQKENINPKQLTEKRLTFLGLVGMIDPPRKEAALAVEKCKRAGMRTIMITGDHKNTAYAVAKEIGIASSVKQVMSGAELDSLSDKEFYKKLDYVNVFARVSPENKVRIVTAFKSKKKIVAMTGDGVNDAPSLKKADIGVGMGITGTDITKEVADMIVTDDNFATIVVAVEEGRKIYKNIEKTIKFLLSANIAEMSSIFLATLFFPQFVFLMPVQILFVNLITDSLPAIALGMELPEKNIMDQPPRKNQNIFAGGLGWSIFIFGMLQTVLIITCYYIGHALYANPNVATTMAFVCLNIIQMFLILSIRTDTFAFKNNPLKNRWLLIAIGFCLAMLILTIYTPLNSVLGLVELGWKEILITIGIAFSIFPISELIKWLFSLKKRKNNKIIAQQLDNK